MIRSASKAGMMCQRDRADGGPVVSVFGRRMNQRMSRISSGAVPVFSCVAVFSGSELDDGLMLTGRGGVVRVW